MVQACTLTSKLWLETSKVRMKLRVQTSKLHSGTSGNFSNPPLNFLLTNFVICFVSKVITPNLKNKPNSKIKVSRKIWKFFRSFNSKFHFSTSNFPIRVSKLGNTLEPFWQSRNLVSQSCLYWVPKIEICEYIQLGPPKIGSKNIDDW